MSASPASEAGKVAERLIVRQPADTDSSKGIARVSAGTAEKMCLRAGSVVRLTGQRSCFARVIPCRTGVLAADEISMPEQLWRNAGSKPDEMVAVAPATPPLLHSVTLQLQGNASVRAEIIRKALLDQPISPGDHLAVSPPGSDGCRAVVESCNPDTGGMITLETTFELAGKGPARVYRQLGGLETQIERVREMVELPMKQPELFDRLGIQPPRGVLFTGPPGSGKTLLARAVAENTDARFFHINAPEIVSKHYGDSEQKLRDVFREAERNAPSIIFIDEIDAIAPKRDAVSGEKQLEKRVVAQLLTLMDGLSERGKVVLMAATNLPHMLDPALRRPGRFDREVPFTAPDRAARLDILGVHTSSMPLAGTVDLKTVAARTDGFVGADLAAVAREAAMAALRRSGALEQSINLSKLDIEQDDFEVALNAVGPSALRETQIETPETGWADVGGLEATKQLLVETILWPLRQGDIAKELGLEPVSGVLLQGPPGSGKTLLARALASESGLNFIPVRASRLLSQYLGEAERLISDLFARARHAAPCLLFFDEIDALAPNRASGEETVSRVVAQLLTEIDGIEGRGGVIVLGATNRIEAVDPALLRPGRFDLTIEIPMPDAQARLEILDVHCRGKPLTSDIDLAELAERADGWAGADLAVLCQGAARQAMKRRLRAGPEQGAPTIRKSDFDAAFLERQQSDELRKRCRA